MTAGPIWSAILGRLDYHNEYHIHLREGSVCWDGFPYPLENVSGLLDIYPDRWEFHKGRGSHDGGEVAIEGQSIPGSVTGFLSDNDGLDLKIEGAESADAGGPVQGHGSQGRRWRGPAKVCARVAGSISTPSSNGESVRSTKSTSLSICWAAARWSRCSSRIRWPIYAADFIITTIVLEISHFQARHDKTRLDIDQGAVDHAGRRRLLYGPEATLRITQLYSDEAFLRALPKALKSFVSTLQLKKPLDIQTRLVISQSPEPGSPPDIGWEGQASLRDAPFTAGVTCEGVDGFVACKGRYNGRQIQGLRGNYGFERASVLKQPFEKVHGRMWIEENSPDILNLDLNAPIFSGSVTGRCRIEFTSALRYELNLWATGISLQELGQHNLGKRSQLEGKMEAQFYLTGLGSNANTLDGNGSIDVPEGRIYNLPYLLDLIKFLGLRLPDRVAFEELHSLFSIHGKRASVRRLELIGSAITLSGTGDFNLDGSDLNLNLYSSLGRLKQVTPQVFEIFPSTFSKNLFLTEVRGQIDSNPDHLKFNMKLLPIITDPLIEIRNRIMGPPAGREPRGEDRERMEGNRSEPER